MYFELKVNQTITVRKQKNNESNVLSLKGVSDYEYPPQKKSFKLLKYFYSNLINKYDWFVRIDFGIFKFIDDLL